LPEGKDTSVLYRDTSLLYYVAIDRSGRGDFGSDLVEYIAQDSVDSAGYVYFYDVKWDVDGSGKDVFTFVCRSMEEEEEIEDDVLSDKQESAENKDNSDSKDKKDGKENRGENEDADLSVSYYNLYPNPTSGRYKIEANLPSETSIVIRLYTVNGNLIKELKDDGKKQYYFDEYMQTQGSYIVEIESIFEKKTFKLTIIY
jgi:hypothetical protein